MYLDTYADNRAVMGNGQPGLISKIQDDVSDLQKWRWRVVGIAVGIAAVCSGGIPLIAWLLKG
jgi:hypothetical protein